MDDPNENVFLTPFIEAELQAMRDSGMSFPNCRYALEQQYDMSSTEAHRILYASDTWTDARELGLELAEMINNHNS